MTSRGPAILVVIAVLTAPIAAHAESAEGLAASLVEQSQPGVIDPIDCPCDDPGSIASDPSAHPLAALSVALSAPTLDDWTARPSTLLATADAPAWPFPTRERRLSLLQTFLI